MSNETFMVGDKVFYSGDRHRQELTREGKPLVGWIHATVVNQPHTYVVWFPDTKEDDSYILAAKWLTKVRPAPDKKHDGPEIQPRRRKREDANG